MSYMIEVTIYNVRNYMSHEHSQPYLFVEVE